VPNTDITNETMNVMRNQYRSTKTANARIKMTTWTDDNPLNSSKTLFIDVKGMLKPITTQIPMEMMKYVDLNALKSLILIPRIRATAYPVSTKAKPRIVQRNVTINRNNIVPNKDSCYCSSGGSTRMSDIFIPFNNKSNLQLTSVQKW
jgi:hypothetical protein